MRFVKHQLHEGQCLWSCADAEISAVSVTAVEIRSQRDPEAAFSGEDTMLHRCYRRGAGMWPSDLELACLCRGIADPSELTDQDEAILLDEEYTLFLPLLDSGVRSIVTKLLDIEHTPAEEGPKLEPFLKWHMQLDVYLNQQYQLTTESEGAVTDEATLKGWHLAGLSPEEAGELWVLAQADEEEA